MSDETPITTDPNEPGNGDDGAGAGDNPSGLKDALEKTLGKQFPDEATALKAVKDTFDYVGKAGRFQQAVKVVMDSKNFSEEQAIDFIKTSANSQPEKMDTSNFVSREELAQRDFFSDKPEYKPYKELVMTFKKANPDKSLTEITGLPEFKSVFDKASAQDQNQKSILHSNPKLGVSKDKMSKASEAQKAGDQANAGKLATESVMEAYDI